MTYNIPNDKKIKQLFMQSKAIEKENLMYFA